MTEKYFKQVPVSHATRELLVLLDKAAKAGYYGYNVSHVVKWAIEGKAQIWQLAGPDCSGVLVTQILEHPAGKELFIWSMAGQGFLANADMIMDRLEAFARAEQCKWIGGSAIHQGLENFYTTWGRLKKQATYFIAEI
jgi:hypothetical protein